MYSIQHVLIVCDVADQQVDVIKSVMQAAMGGHMSVAAFNKMHYARVAIQIKRDPRDAGLKPVAKHFLDYLQMETLFVAGPRGFTTLVHVLLMGTRTKGQRNKGQCSKYSKPD
jgi:23S rRNA U2552 (ribose-2'-O)-methylase RlmE/FtsJ